MSVILWLEISFNKEGHPGDRITKITNRAIRGRSGILHRFLKVTCSSYLVLLQASSCEQFVDDQDHCDHDQYMDKAANIRKGKKADQPSNDQ